jgi:hypothetical protein
VVVIDTKGDTITDLFARPPEHEADKVVLFEPGDARHPRHT